MKLLKSTRNLVCRYLYKNLKQNAIAFKSIVKQANLSKSPGLKILFLFLASYIPKLANLILSPFDDFFYNLKLM